MRSRLITLTAALLCAGPLGAQDWRAVGRLSLGEMGFCTGALIAPDLVLTAAHCLVDESGAPLSPAELQFQAGLTRRSALAYRRIKSFTLHPEFTPDPALSGTALRAKHDLAVLQLYQPITIVAPFAITDQPQEAVTLVSYGTLHSEVMSLEPNCAYLAEDQGIYLFGCRVDFGASGAPVFVQGPNGYEILSVVSAKGVMEGHPVGIGPSLSAEYPKLQPTP